MNLEMSVRKRVALSYFKVVCHRSICLQGWEPNPGPREYGVLTSVSHVSTRRKLWWYEIQFQLVKSCFITKMIHCPINLRTDKFASCARLLSVRQVLWVTPWNRVLEKLIVIQPVTKFPAFYGTRKFTNRVHRSPPLVPILSQIHPVHNLSILFP
jgi:hypothetical protein